MRAILPPQLPIVGQLQPQPLSLSLVARSLGADVSPML
jgi:hypothetical protein